MDLTALKDALAGLTITLTALQASIAPLQAERPQPVEAIVREYFADIPIMAEVAKCESRFRHYDQNGQTLKGDIDPQDRGVMQINERYHLKASKTLGYDIYSLEGNLGYARYLYSLNGVRDWLASSGCWAHAPVDRATGLLGTRGA